MVQNIIPFHIQKEKGVFFDARNEFMKKNRASTSNYFLVFDDKPILDIPPSFDQKLTMKST